MLWRDQVGSELVRSLGYGTGEVAVGVVLVAGPATFRGGDLSVGDLGLFAAYATVIAKLPKWVGRYLVYQRQADVSVDRLAELLPAPRTDVPSWPRTRTYLRHGPPPFAPADAGDVGAPDLAPFDELAVEGLTVRHPVSGRGIHGVDPVVRRGELVVVTGPVGVGQADTAPGPARARRRRRRRDSLERRAREGPLHCAGAAAYRLPPPGPAPFSEPLGNTILLGASGAGLEMRCGPHASTRT